MFQRQTSLLSLIGFLLSLLATVSAAPSQLSRRGIEGKASFYLQGGAIGACGKAHNDGNYIVALAPSHFAGKNPCGRKVKVYAKSGSGKGRSVMLTVADKCMGCTPSHVDLAVGPFEYLAAGKGLNVGILQVAWAFK